MFGPNQSKSDGETETVTRYQTSWTHAQFLMVVRIVNHLLLPGNCTAAETNVEKSPQEVETLPIKSRLIVQPFKEEE